MSNRLHQAEAIPTSQDGRSLSRLEQFLGAKAPPGDGIPIERASRQFRKGFRAIEQAILSGELGAGIAHRRFKGLRGPVRCILVSARDCRRLWGEPNKTDGPEEAVAADLEPVSDLAAAFGVAEETIRTWCEWDPHPALAGKSSPHPRRIRTSAGTRSVETTNGHVRQYSGRLFASRADVEECVATLNMNPTTERIGDNPGRWILVDEPRGKRGAENKESRKEGKHYVGIKGVFERGDSLKFYTQAALKEKYKWPRSLFSKECYTKKLDRIDVVLPGVRSQWRIPVYSEASAETLDKQRKGKTKDGDWDVPNMVWRENRRLWYSTKFILKRFAGYGRIVPHYQIHNWTQQAKLTVFKNVPRSRDKNSMKGSPVRVYHQAEIDPLIELAEAIKPFVFNPSGLDAGATNAAQATKAKGKRGRITSDRQKKINETCAELQKRVRDQGDDMTNMAAVAEVESIYGKLSLGGEFASNDVKKRRFQLNADAHRASQNP